MKIISKKRIAKREAPLYQNKKGKPNDSPWTGKFYFPEILYVFFSHRFKEIMADVKRFFIYHKLNRLNNL
jgi:hypothetical protein